MRPTRTGRGPIVTGLLLLLMCGAVQAQEAASACGVRETERWPAVLENGSHVYVEPIDLTVIGERALLAGTPTYVTPPGQTGRDAVFEKNTIAGLMLTADRGAVPVPWPVPDRHFRVMRAAALADSTWVFFFDESAAQATIPDTLPLVDLWFGRWDGARWREIERIPAPPRPGVKTVAPSSVVPFGDGFAWALPYDNGLGDRGAQILLREGTGWRWEVALARHGTYVELWPDGSALAAALTTSDGKRNMGTNPLFRFARDTAWTMGPMLSPGGDEPVYWPRALRSGDRIALTWRSFIAPDWHTQAILDVDAKPVVITTIDPSMSYLDTLIGPDGRVIWATEHVAPDDGRTLRFARHAVYRVEPLGELPSPFRGRSASERFRDGLLVAGPRFSEAADQVALITLVLRLSIDCEER